MPRHHAIAPTFKCRGEVSRGNERASRGNGRPVAHNHDDAESINRHLDDTMWLGRSYSIGHARQHLNLLGFALTLNSLALQPGDQRAPKPAQAASAAISPHTSRQEHPETPLPLSWAA
jgi:hypothetical protein